EVNNQTISFGMFMPSMGKTLANAFQSPIFFFSYYLYQRFLPHFFLPKNQLPIFLAYSTSQFSVLKLKEPLLFYYPLEAIGLSRSFKVGGKIC
ncbi:hypothetical protein VP01_1104g3, partial [Puccinia sorghi]